MNALPTLSAKAGGGHDIPTETASERRPAVNRRAQKPRDCHAGGQIRPWPKAVAAFMRAACQALVRLPMLQRQRDAAAGLNTAGFISGYRGSRWHPRPGAVGGQTRTWQPTTSSSARRERRIGPPPWGTQQLTCTPKKKYDGVFGIWYGSRVDRCSDVFKHANMAGTVQTRRRSPLPGDDHISKSSIRAPERPHLRACGMPVFFPAACRRF